MYKIPSMGRENTLAILVGKFLECLLTCREFTECVGVVYSKNGGG